MILASVSAGQSRKASAPIAVLTVGKVTSASASQARKAPSPIEAALGSCTEVRDVQPSKALVPTETTPERSAAASDWQHCTAASPTDDSAPVMDSFFKDVQPEKTPLSSDIFLPVRETSVSAVQPENASLPMAAEQAACTEASFSQPLNAEAPRAVRLSGRSMAVRALQFSNAEAPTVFSRAGIVTEVSFPQPLKVLSLIAVTPLGSAIDVRASQYANANAPMVVTPLGRSIDTRALQPANADAPMAVTPRGIVILVRLVQS